MKRTKTDKISSILWLLPSIILVGIFVYVFIGNTIYNSMTDWGAYAGLMEHPVKNFVGIANYRDLFTGFINERFRQDLINAVFYSLLLISGSLIMGFLLAILLDKSPKGESAFKTIFLYPLSLSFIVTGTIWRWLFAPNGGLNVLPTIVGLPKINFLWLSSRTTIFQFNWQHILKIIAIILFVLFALFLLNEIRKKNRTKVIIYSALCILCLVYAFLIHRHVPLAGIMEETHGFNLATIGVIIAAVWQYSGYTMALYLAGLRQLPEGIYEAAKMDGANDMQYYFKIAIPNMWPITFSAIIILSHISLKIFDLIFAMAGPDNANVSHPSVLMYTTTFRANQFAVGSAISVILFAFSAIFIIPNLVNLYKQRRKL